MSNHAFEGFVERLSEFLCSILVLCESHNRDALLDGLPQGPVNSIERQNSIEGDIRTIVRTAASWRRVETGTYALTQVMNNALRFVQGTEQERVLQGFQDELDHLEEEPVIFVNRRNEIEDLYRQSSFLSQSWAIDAPAGFGKTTLILELKSYYEKEDSRKWVCVYIKIPRRNPWGIIKISNEMAETLGLSAFKGRPSPARMGRQLADMLLKSKRLKESLFKGVAIFFDNIDVLDSDELGKLLELIEGIKQGLGHAGFWQLQANRFRAFLAGRHISNQISDAATPYVLSPFNFEAVEESVVEHALRSGFATSSHDIPAQLLYLTGGHPGAMAQLLQQMAQTSFADAYDILEEEQIAGELIAGVISEIKRDFMRRGVNREVFEILQTLSVFRRYRTWLLDAMVKRGFVHWDGTVLDLERTLQDTRLVTKDRGYLMDEITRRLLVIGLRSEDHRSDGEFCRICREGIALYESNLNTTWKPELVATEWLYQKLQYGFFCSKPAGESTFVQEMEEAITKVLATLESMEEGAARISNDLVGELEEDWEFQFLYNFFMSKQGGNTYSSSPYKALIDRIESF